MNPLTEFVSTYDELHYLVGGLCLGFVLGWISHALFHLVHAHP